MLEIQKLRLASKAKVKLGRYSPFYQEGGTCLMKVARVDADKILEAARARKLTCAQVIHSRDW